MAADRRAIWCRSLQWAAGIACALLVFHGRSSHGAANAPSLDGDWQGTLAIAHTRESGTAAGTLAQSSRRTVTGSVDLASTGASGRFTAVGRVRGHRAHILGVLGQQRLRWRAHWNRKLGVWRGPLTVHGAGKGLHGVLVMERPGDNPGAACGARDFFTAEVMPKLLEPNCGQCHVDGGAAQATTFRVTVGDARSTLHTALRHVDTTTPAHSRILQKPRAEVPHGGGQRIVPGSAEDQLLSHWVDLVTSPDCNPGGGGGGGGGTGNLYLDNCASCHGSDARGVQGRPDIHCTRNIHDAVRNGRTGATEDMPAFPNLSDTDIGTIQAFLVGLCPAAGVTGAELFAGNCASCHGADAGGTAGNPSVRCATRVGDAVRTGRATAMPSFPAALLSDAELGLIEAYLSQRCTQAGRTGADLWAGNCASCHGADATGGRDALGHEGPDVQCNRDIQEPVQTGKDDTMPAFPGLSLTDIGRIQQFLGGLCPAGTATGARLFAGNCASCHGPDARGVNGQSNIRCNRSIHDAVRSGRNGPAGTMPALNGITDAEITRLQSYLVGLCPAGTASGSDLWGSNCASCHGTDGGGTIDAPSVRCATLVSDAVSRGRAAAMPAFSTLTGADLTALTGHMAQLCTQHGRTGADLWAGNCSTCHGASANGGRSALGVDGPDVRCTGRNDYLEKVRQGDDNMPAFPALGTTDVDAMVTYVHGAFCPGG
ncbi:MAG: c-type cytochrome [Candidatus Binatia bacterium]